jgi:hypothetical protein
MARIFIGGREIEVPTDGGNVDVRQVREAVGVPENRVLIRQLPSGENFVTPRRGQMRLDPYEHFLEAPICVRGKSEHGKTGQTGVGAPSTACGFDQHSGSGWVLATNFILPPGYNFRSIPVVFEIPSGYPESLPKTKECEN